MSHNLRVTNILENMLQKPKYEKIDAREFITRANDTSLIIQEGIIESLYVINDSVFAIIRKNEEAVFSPSGDLVEHGDSLFNGSDGVDVDEMLVPELSILTNIDSSNNQLKRFVGKTAKVVVKNNTAVFADVSLGYPSITTVPANVIRKIRNSIASESNNLFSEIGKKAFKEEGYTDEDIKALSDFKYVESMTGKINTFEGEALWFKDTSQKTKDENILQTSSILVGLNKLGMKSKKCHIPSRLFSGK